MGKNLHLMRNMWVAEGGRDTLPAGRDENQGDTKDRDDRSLQNIPVTVYVMPRACSASGTTRRVYCLGGGGGGGVECGGVMGGAAGQGAVQGHGQQQVQEVKDFLPPDG